MYKRKDGRYIASIYINKKKKFIYAKTQKELENKLIEIKSLRNKGLVINNNEITLGKWAVEWKELYKNNLELATQNMYDRAIIIINNKIGYIKLKNLKENHIQLLLNDYKNKNRQQEILYLTIKQILNKAVDNDLIYKNVANKIKIKKKKAKEKEPLPEETIKKIQEKLKDNNVFIIRFYAIYGYS